MTNAYKLLSATVALKKEGVKNDYLFAHHELISGVPLGGKRSVMVTFGLYAPPGIPVGIYASVAPKGQEPKIGSIKYSESFYTTLRSTPVANDKGVFLMTLEVKDVLFEYDGLYEAIVRVYPSEEMPSEEGELDSITCFFYVVTSEGDRNATA
ncbi:TPA: hypothetical protein ACNV5T_003385 [Klebsiella michiganensis]|uniref:hypothetical protein n=1 Tax=Klebsiella michiganensis TaxID=1134687 RepID=UPI001CCD99BE|nr:hypothetical protein [Klebsiella michiganensis]MBZ6860966.1 hypothetical protein [Klebsiella michiganensis]MBZ7420920.1 hypothetical protein [Klebsiella michiganensis]MDS7846575.1 hypothetical protein [Klebsiella michiganensis]MDS7918877.1 hypothetical protein [Klebsiella michiganensis]MDU6716589.1 hypothetical protein [Klebsiella michiganensis]